MWSLGCIIYYMCTSKPPFINADILSLCRSVKQQVTERIVTLNNNTQFQEVIDELLQKDFRRRLRAIHLLRKPIFQTYLRNSCQGEQLSRIMTIEYADEMCNYTLEECLGRGEYGELFRVTRESDGNFYSMINIQMKDELDDVHITELKSLVVADSRHPYILHIVDLFYGRQCISLLIGHDTRTNLDDVLKCHYEDPLDYKTIIDWLTQLSLAVEYLHSQSIVHQHIQPKNIWIDKHIHLHLMYGKVASIAESKGIHTDISSPSLIVYRAPELWSETASLSAAADMWSMGCILHQLCTYKLPFRALTKGGLIQSILAEINDRIPPNQYHTDVQEIIDGLLEKDATKRLTALELLNKPCLMLHGKRLSKNELSARLHAMSFTSNPRRSKKTSLFKCVRH